MLINIVLILLGLGFLVAGGEFLVKGAVGLATKAKISKLVIGMTVVAFGTSVPELLVSLRSAAEGLPEIAVGNVVGSNILNITLVLGVTAIVFPILVSRNSIRIDWPVMMFFTILLFVFAQDLVIELWEGVVLFVLQVAFVIFIIYRSRVDQIKRREGVEELDIPDVKDGPIWMHLGLFIIGIVGLYFGANWLIEGAKSLAEEIGVSKRIIGVTIVAFGTSVPELATSVIAAYKKEADISIGNLIGSNIFNISMVLGLTAIVSPISVNEEFVSWDFLWVLGASALLLPIMLAKRKVGFIGGTILVIVCLVYGITLF